MELLDVFKALADENRLRILNILNRKELCVCELESILGLNQSNASRHLTRLKDSRLIYAEKQAQFVFYKIDSDTLAQFPFLKGAIQDELGKNPKMQKDLKKLEDFIRTGKLCQRESGNCCN